MMLCLCVRVVRWMLFGGRSSFGGSWIVVGSRLGIGMKVRVWRGLLVE